VGQSLFEASFHYPNAVIVGNMVEDSSGKQYCDFCASGSHRLKDQEEVVFLGEDLSSTVASKAPCTQPLLLSSGNSFVPGAKSQDDQPESLIIIGWNELVGILVLELDQLVPPGSELLTLSSNSPDTRSSFLARSQKRFNVTLQNITKIQHIQGELGSRFQLDALPIERASRIFILADQHAPTSSHADACTLGAVAQIRDILVEKDVSKDIAIVPEILETETEHHCSAIKASEFIDSSIAIKDLSHGRIPAQDLECARPALIREQWCGFLYQKARRVPSIGGARTQGH
jgi:hypothetical protein